ncbi:alpha-1,4-N-acetylglucosaminyltransferase [Perognathus longimembris pacificus]|uniref:alpha-1,4-N-acetylglucosaminyltransferase n=1 Tax=Perognathus longimembris pacificus TaxID=214514 RepID=UPI002019096C|nr:alpha-1,4-N-acetylglucosaminyltransferase [Perognathus longimembris pacificus]
MLKELRLSLSLVLLLACGFLYRLSLKSGCLFSCGPAFKSPQGPESVLSRGRSIVFIETSERLEPPPLVSCALESAAKVYPGQPVAFFMKGLSNGTRLTPNSSYPALSLLSAMDNVFFFPLDMERLFEGTPLLAWYTRIDSEREQYWLHVSADAARLAVVWKYGGVYMDTDLISLRPVPDENFVAAQGSGSCSNGVFGFEPRHPFLWACMENFVEHYNSRVWGNQGPLLMTRMLRVRCRLGAFPRRGRGDLRCGDLSVLHPDRFYPIPFRQWGRYYQVWDPPDPAFRASYALHLWNFMNRRERKTVRPGSGTLAERLYRRHCPGTYGRLLLRGPTPPPGPGPRGAPAA